MGRKSCICNSIRYEGVFRWIGLPTEPTDFFREQTGLNPAAGDGNGWESHLSNLNKK